MTLNTSSPEALLSQYGMDLAAMVAAGTPVPEACSRMSDRAEAEGAGQVAAEITARVTARTAAGTDPATAVTTTVSELLGEFRAHLEELSRERLAVVAPNTTARRRWFSRTRTAPTPAAPHPGLPPDWSAVARSAQAWRKDAANRDEGPTDAPAPATPSPTVAAGGPAGGAAADTAPGRAPRHPETQGAAREPTHRLGPDDPGSRDDSPTGTPQPEWETLATAQDRALSAAGGLISSLAALSSADPDAARILLDSIIATLEEGLRDAAPPSRGRHAL